MKKAILSLLVVFAVTAHATPALNPATTEDQAQAEADAKAQADQKPSIEQRRAELKKKHKDKKKAKADAKAAADAQAAANAQAVANAPKPNASSTDTTSVRAKEAVKDMQDQIKTEQQREERSSH